jgi:hypothetical protein
MLKLEDPTRFNEIVRTMALNLKPPSPLRHYIGMKVLTGCCSHQRTYSGGRSSPVRSFATSDDRSGSGTSQSMQRNLRPPVLTRINRIGLPHLEQLGGEEFLGMTFTLDQAPSITELTVAG